jgi:acetyltransferase
LESTHYLTPLFEPASVAVVGASATPGKVGTLVFDNVLAAGYHGRLFAVNPKHDEVRGVRCVASLEDIREPIDLAVICTPAATVPGVIAQCGRAGVRAAIVISGGFSEAGPEGVAREAALLEAARRAGVRILGPNCLGLLRPSIGLNATFARGSAQAGSLALVSQSGAVCTALLDWAAANGVGFSSVISLGGSADVDFGEAIDYLAADSRTEHILMYVEGVREGRRLVGSLRAAARSKPVILMKVGRHPVGSRAAVSHTGAIVGLDDVFDAVVRRTGVVRVQSMTDLVLAAQALASHVRPAGGRLAIVTNGGGPGVMAADRAADLGLPLAELAPATIERLKQALPATWSHGNPVDLIGDADAARYSQAMRACLEDSGVDGVLAILTPQAMTDAHSAAEAVIEAARGSAKPVLAAWMGEASVGTARARLRKAGIPAYEAPEPAVQSFAYLADFYRNQRALLEAPGPLAHREPPDLQSARALVRSVLAQGRSALSGAEARSLLAAFRIPSVAASAASSADAAVAAAEIAGYPVAMKIDSPEITHKSDVGGVRLMLADAAAVRDAFASMLAGVSRARPDATLRGVTIEPMAGGAHSRELLAGIVRDPVFGPAVTFGAGGVAVEVLKDRAVALPPLNARLVADMIGGTRIAKMLGPFRNLPAVDRAALEGVLLRVSEMACELPEIDELDINPLVADESGVVALDARVTLRARKTAGAGYGHLAIAPYPGELASTLRLDDGSWLEVRPIRPEDAAMEQAFVTGLSPLARGMRFQSGLRSLSPAMLARFTQIDYDREMALVAVRQENGAARQVGVARYIRLPDAKTCEYAIVVGDEWQRRGLGRHLMAALIDIARQRGIETMEGRVLASNNRMLELCAELGFAIERMPDEPQVRRVTLALKRKRSAAPLELPA